MQKFSYRNPRYAVDIPVVLESGSARCQGQCREISKEGMRIELEGDLPGDFSGTAVLSYQKISVRVGVGIVLSSAPEYRLKFIFSGESERTAIERLVTVLAERAGSHGGPVLVQ